MDVSESHKVQKPPSLTFLEELKVIEKVAVDECFHILILKDDFGHELDIIKRDNPHSVVDVSTGVFQSWLRGSGRQPATWKTLVEVLRECDLNNLADNITSTVSKDVMNVEPLPYSHSPEVAGFVKWLKKNYSIKSVVDSPLLHRVKGVNELNVVNLTFLNDTNFRLTMGQFLYQMDRLQNEQNKLMVITGDPGSGKTTLMKYLAREWAEGKILKSCQILLLIHLGRCKEEYKSLSDLLKDTKYKDCENIEQIAKIIGEEHGKGACFLLDAYDERLAKSDFLEDMIKMNRLPYSTCIVTSRPSFAVADKPRNIAYYYKIVGFDEEYIVNYVSQLPKEINMSIHHLWSEYRGLKQACRSPLYLSLMVYIVALDPNREFSSNTMTQLYLGVIDSLITHYKTLHPQWNAHSLRNCIIRKPQCQDDVLCCAFTTLQHVAFGMVFKKVDYFEMEEASLYESIQDLRIVSIHPVDHINVTYQFAHHTFAEFFAAFHLTTLPLDELLFYVTNYPYYDVVWEFYFGLMGKYYSECVKTMSTVFKRYIRVSYLMLHIPAYDEICYLYCGATRNQLPITPSILRVIQDSVDKDFYTSTGIVVNSSVIIHDWHDLKATDFILLQNNLFSVATVHKLCFHVSGFGMIAMEDWSLKLNKIHLDFVQNAMSLHESTIPVVLPETTSITSTCHHVYKSSTHRIFEIFPDSYQNVLVVSNLMFKSLSDRLNIYPYNIHDDALRYVSDIVIPNYDDSVNLDMLSKFSSLQTLKLVSNTFNRSSNLQLCSKQRNSGMLHTLELFDLSCEDEPMYLDCLTELKRFHIRDSNLSECTDDFVHRLSRNKGLTTLKISDSEIEIPKLLVNLTYFTILEELCLEDIGLNDSDVSVLSLSLKNLTLLNALSLSSEFMTDTSVKTLANALSSESHQNFRKLSLRYNYIGKNESYFLELARLTGLTHLILEPLVWYDNLFEIVKVLETLPQLTHLCWASDSLTNDENDSLIKAVNNLTDLWYLRFHACRYIFFILSD